jgi:hypothetical protein
VEDLIVWGNLKARMPTTMPFLKNDGRYNIIVECKKL